MPSSHCALQKKKKKQPKNRRYQSRFYFGDDTLLFAEVTSSRQNSFCVPFFDFLGKELPLDDDSCILSPASPAILGNVIRLWSFIDGLVSEVFALDSGCHDGLHLAEHVDEAAVEDVEAGGTQYIIRVMLVSFLHPPLIQWSLDGLLAAKLLVRLYSHRFWIRHHLILLMLWLSRGKKILEQLSRTRFFTWQWRKGREFQIP